MQRTDDRLILADKSRARIFFGWNSREIKIGYYYVDGYANVDGKRIIYEFDGCAYHSCDLCKTRFIEKDDKKRTKFLSSLKNTEIVRISECQWHNLRKTIDFGESKISKLLYKNTISELTLINMLHKNEIYGFVLVDIYATDKAQKFIDINWPPLIFKEEVEYSDLPEYMRPLAAENEFPKMSILQGMFRKNLLLHTDLLAFYVQNGFKVTKIHKFYEYEPSNCFEDVFKTVYEARVAATQNKDDLKSTAIKLVSNSMYGQMLMVSLENLRNTFGAYLV